MSRYAFNGKERRAYVRLDTTLKVMLRFSENKSDKTYTVTTKNISHGGLCLEVPHNHKELIEKLHTTRKKPGIHLNAAILNKDLELSAKPAWINCRFDYVRKATPKKPAFLMGLAFNKLPEVARKQIHNYIANEFIKRYGRDDRSKESET
jgi:c-di-GMP-binding flagellar brake protein YcgR